MPDVGDRVVYFDEHGDRKEGVVYSTYAADDMIDVVYNEASDDGSFERANGARYDRQLVVDTSVQLATENGQPQSYAPGGWGKA